MRIINVKTYEQLSRKAANIISAQVILKPDCVLGLATGSSPVGTYRQLIEWYNKGDIDFSETTTVNLDEYVGLGENDEQSYRYFMQSRQISVVAQGSVARRSYTRADSGRCGVAQAGGTYEVAGICAGGDACVPPIA